VRDLLVQAAERARADLSKTIHAGAGSGPRRDAGGASGPAREAVTDLDGDVRLPGVRRQGVLQSCFGSTLVDADVASARLRAAQSSAPGVARPAPRQREVQGVGSPGPLEPTCSTSTTTDPLRPRQWGNEA